MGFWRSAIERVGGFLPTAVRGPEELATYTAGLFGLCVILVGFGFGAILVAPFFRASLAEGLATFVVILLNALMFLSGGAILGLLFGIPRYAKVDGVESAVAPNNNLEQISDWLTKMIVGIGLVEFQQIIAKLKALSLQVTQAIAGCDALGRADNYSLGLAVIGFFTAAGFLMMYLWARVYLLLDVGSVQDKISRDAIALKDFLADPSRVQGTQRQKNLGVKARAASEALNLRAGEQIEPGPDTDDPWKGAFGGKSRDEAKARELVAEVTPLKRPKDYCSVRLTVRSTDREKPLKGEVKFFLHDTFPQPIQSVSATDNKAELEVKAWGAFTVGALMDEGTTKLELDLSHLEGAPADWRTR